MLKLTFANGQKINLDVKTNPQASRVAIALAVKINGKIMKASHEHE